MGGWPKGQMKDELLKLARVGRQGADGRRPLELLSSCPVLLSVVPPGLLETESTDDNAKADALAGLLEHVAFDVTSANENRNRVQAFGDLLGLTQLEPDEIKDIYESSADSKKTDKFVRYSRGVRLMLAARRFQRGIQWAKGEEPKWAVAFVDELCTYLGDLPADDSPHKIWLSSLKARLDTLRNGWQIGIVGVAIGALTAVAITYPLASRGGDVTTPIRELGDYTPAAPKPPPSSVPSSKFDNTGTWGPQERPTFTVNEPPRYAVFNSITNSAYGDERAFIGCKDKAQPDDRLVSNIAAEDGHFYVCRVAVNNDVADNLDDGNPTAWLHNARLTLSLPGDFIYNPGVQATLMANNANAVWATCNFVAPRPMRFLYSGDSARMFTNATSNAGLQLSYGYGDILTSPGTQLGYDRQDGIIRHSGQYTAFVWFEISVVLDPGR